MAENVYGRSEIDDLSDKLRLRVPVSPPFAWDKNHHFSGNFLPGKAAGFSCVRSRKPPLIPVASVMLDSPNLSRRRSAAESGD